MRFIFRYFNRSFKILCTILVPLQNFILPPIIASFFIRVIGLIGLGQYFNNDLIISIIQKIVIFVSILWAAIYIFFRKGVFLYDDYLVIARYTITLRNWKNRIKIKYDDIDHVNVNYTDLRFTKHHGSLLVPCGDNTYNVEITLKNGKKYFFSIENQEEFVSELLSRMDRR